MQKIEVTKLDAGRRQLRTAIRLWFAEDDPVSIFSLAYASHEVIHTLHKNQGGTHGLVFDSPAMTVNVQKIVTQGIKDWGNFLKHADRDPDKQIAFKPDIAELLMLASAGTLQTLTNEIGAEEAALHFWFAAHNPDAFETLENAEFLAVVRADYQTKAEFWTYMRANWGTTITWACGVSKRAGP